MNSLLQTESFLIGSENDVLELSRKQNARLLVYSDSHGNGDVVRNMLDHFSSGLDAVVFCGDGAGELVSLMTAAFRNKRGFNKLPPVIAMVKGNGDCEFWPVTFPVRKNPEATPDGSEFNELVIPHNVMFNVAGMNIYLTHGHENGVYYGLENLAYTALERQASLVFYGHTHVAARVVSNSMYLVNPGSCSSPRRGLPPSCAVVDINGVKKTFEVVFHRITPSSKGWEFTPFIPALSALL